ncbi:MAG: cell division protein FtsL [Treponema sp.]|jgi:cell division protein FtsL|nr:cell division protein FtsL [Treponema sp.]
MIKKYILLYFFVFSIPLLMGLLVWQSHRYTSLSNDLIRMERAQTEWIESNKRLIAIISEYSSAQRIDYIARNQLDLRKIPPEYFRQVRIMGGKEHEY